MSVINLMLLGFFMEKPRNAYEIKKEVESRNLSWWVKGSSPSIYRNINSLADRGYLDGKVVRESEMPEKTVYTINEKGKLYFAELMESYSHEPPQVYMDFTAVIANIGKVDQETGKHLIDNLYAAFYKNIDILKSIKNMYEPYQAKSVIQLSEQINTLLCQWLQQFKEGFYTKDTSKSDPEDITDSNII